MLVECVVLSYRPFFADTTLVMENEYGEKSLTEHNDVQLSGLFPLVWTGFSQVALWDFFLPFFQLPSRKSRVQVSSNVRFCVM